jgi:hypothetical protein
VWFSSHCNGEEVSENMFVKDTITINSVYVLEHLHVLTRPKKHHVIKEGVGRESIFIWKTLTEVTRHAIWVEQNSRLVEHALLIQLWLLYPYQLLIGCLAKLHPSLSHSSRKILHTLNSQNITENRTYWYFGVGSSYTRRQRNWQIV